MFVSATRWSIRPVGDKQKKRKCIFIANKNVENKNGILCFIIVLPTSPLCDSLQLLACPDSFPVGLSNKPLPLKCSYIEIHTSIFNIHSVKVAGIYLIELFRDRSFIPIHSASFTKSFLFLSCFPLFFIMFAGLLLRCEMSCLHCF